VGAGYRRRGGLTEQQLIALDAFLGGGTDGEAAEAAGVDRITAWRWRHHDHLFRAELEKLRTARRAAIAELVEATDRAALEVVARATHTGDPAVALAYLRIRGSAALSIHEPGEPIAQSVDEVLSAVAAAIREEVGPEVWGRIAARVSGLAAVAAGDGERRKENDEARRPT